MHSKRQSKRPKRWWLVRKMRFGSGFARLVLAECATAEAARREQRLYSRRLETRVVEVK